MSKYALVGCTECDWLWITGTTADTTRCTRCAARYDLDSLTRFAASDERQACVEARGQMLKERASAVSE